MDASFRSRFASLMMLLLILTALPAQAYADNYQHGPSETDVAYFQGTGTGAGTGTAGTGTGTTAGGPSVVNTPTGAQFSCRTEQANPQDLQNFMDLLNKGYLGNEIGSGLPANQNRDELENAEIFDIIDKKTGKALKQSMPDQKFSSLEVQQWLNSGIKGPYSFGLILTDTLRLGRCPVADSAEDFNNLSCWLDETRLKYRNSGVGIVADFKPMIETMKDVTVNAPLRWLGFDDNGFETYSESDFVEDRKIFGLPDSAQDAFERYVVESNEEVELQTYKRTTENPIRNSILTDKFSSQFQTTCSGSGTDCVISVYSMFDKYYNANYSGEQVISTFMPTLWFRAKKLFNFTGRGGEANVHDGIWPWSAPYRRVMDNIRAKMFDPIDGSALAQFLANRRSAKIYELLRKYPSFGKFNSGLFEPHEWADGYLLTKGTAFRQWFYKEFTSGGGILEEIQKRSKSEQKAFLRLLKEIRDAARTQSALGWGAKREYDAVLGRFGYGSAQELAARIKYAQGVTKAHRGWDHVNRTDIGEWLFQKDESAGLYHYFVKPKGQDIHLPIYRDPAQWNQLESKFWRDGHFGGDNWPSGQLGVERYETAGRNLTLFEPDPIRRVDTARARDILRHPPRFTEKFIATDNAKIMKVDPEMTPYLQDTLGTRGEVFVGGYRKALELTPEDFAARVTTKRSIQTFWETVRNSEQMYLASLERGFAGHPYSNVLGKALSERDELLRDYFSLKGGPKWTAGMYAYWWGKRGFGNEKFSAYQLADDWLRISWPLKDTPLYDDAYVDFFSNAGSDQGDIFVRILQSLPIDKILSTAADQFDATRDLYNNLTGRKTRDTVENIAIFSSTPDSCSNCSLVLTGRNNLQTWQGNFRSNNPIKSYILEDTTKESLKDTGQTLITFTHHTNLEGQVKSDSTLNGTIDLAEALEEHNTCAEIVQELSLGTVLTGGIIDLGPDADILPGITAAQATRNQKQKNPAAIGLYLATVDSLGYLIFGWSAITATLAQQTILAPKLQNCVDHIEGYFNHLSAASKEAENQKAAQQQEASEQAVAGVQGFLDTTAGWFSSGEASFTHEAANEQKNQLTEFLNQPKKNEIIEAFFETQGNAQGNLGGDQLLSFWFKGTADPAKYKTEGKRVITDEKHGITVTDDYEKGETTVEQDGVTEDLITNPDITRLASVNTDAVAQQYPNRLGYVPLRGDAPMFEMNIRSDLTVLDPVILNCIKQTVLEQSGIALNSNNLSEVFGKVTNISTDSHPNVQAWPNNNRIVADGIVRRFVEGQNARVIMAANRETKLVGFESKDIGFLDSIQFDHGLIVVKPETQELLVWLKRNRKSIITQDDVLDLKVKEDSTINPENGCTEPAFQLSALPVPGSPQIGARVNNFNTSLQTQGPFQHFETPSKRFSFYSKRVNGQCKNFLSLLDKATGEVTEIPIDSLITTPNGIKVIGDDGSEHNLEFSAPNGVPTLQYNNNPPETLLNAQGRNGSFWYDPNTGNWYSSNSNLLPLIEAFRDGILTKVGSDGKATSQASGNILSLNLGAGTGNAFNLPSLPEEPALVLVFVLLLLGSFIGTQRRFASKKQRKKSKN